MVSLKDIAASCGVSVATVSKALNGYPDVGEETREKIQQAAREKGYYPNSSARALKTRHTSQLGVLFVDQGNSGLTHDYFCRVLESFKKTADAAGYDICFACRKLAARDLSYLEHFSYRNVDGVVIACVNFDNPQVQELIRSDIPMVTIDHIMDGRISVGSNNLSGMETLVSYICDCGHTRIAYIHGENTSVTKARLSGYHRILQSRNIEDNDLYVKEAAYRDADRSAECTTELLKLPQPPTCILYPDDYAAMGGIRVIREMGLRIPEDISVAGYDGFEISKVLVPKLTTFRQNTEKIGKIAAQKLIELIENPKTTAAEHYSIEGSLIKGSSVRKKVKVNIA